MATINVTLRTDKKPNEHDEYPVMIRLYHQKNMYPYSFDFKVHQKFWNSDTQQVKRCTFYEDYGKMNHIINQKKQRAENILKNQLDQDPNIDPELLRKIISLDLKEEKRDSSVCVISFCDLLIEKGKGQNKHSTVRNYENLKSKLKEFTGKDSLLYRDIDSFFVENFFEWLKFKKRNRRTGEKGLHHNTALRSVEYLRSTYRKAQKKFRNIRRDNPFFEFDESPVETESEYLNQQQLERLMDIETDSPNAEISKDMFIFAVYSCGMRFSDVFRLTWDHIDMDDQVVEFIPYKTSKDKKGRMINPIGEEAMYIVKKYHQKNGDKKYMWDWANKTSLPIDTKDGLHRLKRSNAVTVNKELKKFTDQVGKEINFHMSRHTFSNLIKKSGMSVAEISEIFAHSDISITRRYLKKLVNTDNTDKRESLKKAIKGF